MFNSIAHQYNLMNDIMTAFSHRRTRKITVKLSNFKHDQRALDLATGTGDLAFLLLKEGRGTVIGVDISDKMLSKAKSRNLGTNGYIALKRVDINHLPFHEEVFDICTISYGIRNVHNPLVTMKEVARVTKKGGRFIIVEATPSTNRYARLLAHFYFGKITPLLAKILSLDAAAYIYFAESISQFPKSSDFTKIIKRAGWKKVFYYPLYFGTVTVFLAFK